ncbi:MAG: LamG domain-containing protein [Planctomycetes bacterium]|nr:LamG domain-containing protein [Planctomycetota bacterium]
MYKRLIFLISIVLLLSLPAAANNLLLNTGFETEGVSGAQDANAWVESGDAKRENWGDFSERGTGSWGIAIMDWSGDKDGEVYQDVDGIAGSTLYNFYIWTKRDAGDVNGVFYMTLEWYEDDAYISEDSQNITLTDGWTEQSLSATSPGNANEVRVLFGQDTDKCGKWDDAYFGIPEAARNQSPAEGAEDVSLRAFLSWTAGDGAVSHDVYLGTDYNDVAGANTLDDEYEGNTNDPNYNTSVLVLGTTYYWRIDEVNGTATEGNVWSFTTQEKLVRNPSFEDNDGYGGGSAAHWTNTGDTGIEGWANHTGSWGMATYSWGDVKNGTIYQDVPVTEDTGYAYSLWISGDGGSAGNYYMKVEWYNGETLIEPNSSVDITAKVNGATWVEEIFIVTSPAGCDTARLMIDGVDFTKVGKFDDADFRNAGVAYDPDPEDEAERVSEDTILSWIAGEGTATHDVYLGTSLSDVNDANTSDTTGIYRGNQVYSANSYDPSGLEFETTYYWRVDEVNVATVKGEVWSFTVIPPIAREPNPGYGVITDNENVTLSWLPGAYVQDVSGHEVYFGTNWGAVYDANKSYDEYQGAYDTNSYDPGTLSFDTTYYWRVDEVNGPNTWKGDVWVFYINENLLRNPGFEYNGGSGGDEADWWAGTESAGVEDWAAHTGSWGMALTSWENGGTGEVYQDTIPVTENMPYLYKLWVHRDPGTLAGQFNMTVEWLNADGNSISEYSEDISADMSADYWTEKVLSVIAPAGSVEAKVIIDSNEINCTGKFDDAYFGMIPQDAYGPSPGDGVTSVATDADLSWAPGRDVQATNEHGVYFGTDWDDVNDANSSSHPNVVYTVRDVNNYDPGTLDLGTTYYWRVDEVNGTTIWPGEVWSFTTINHIVLEDFENPPYGTYQELQAVWKPTAGAGISDVKLNVNVSGPAHEGSQSMWLKDNSDTAAEAQAGTADPNLGGIGPDWTVAGVKALDIWFYGDAANPANQMYIKLEDASGHIGRVDYDGSVANLSTEEWQVWHIALQEFVDDNSVNLAQISKITIGIDGGDEYFDGAIYFDDLRLYLPRCISEEIVTDFTGDCFVGYEDLDLMTENWLVGDYNVTTSAPNDLSSALMAWYKLDGDATDSSTNGNHGTLGTDPNDPAWVGSGKIGTDSLSFDGGDSVNCGQFDPSGDANELTVAAWAYWDGIGGDHQSIVAKRDVWNDQGDDMMWQLSISKVCDGSFKAEFVRGGDTSSLGSAGRMPKAEWVHLAASCDGTSGTFYINGREMKTSDFTFGSDTTAHVVIGATDVNSNEGFSGDIDDVRMYNYALSEAEVAYLVAEGAGTLYVPLDLETEEFDIYEDARINFKDYAVLAEDWLEDILWP